VKIVFVINARLVSGAEEHLLDLTKMLPDYGIEPVMFVRAGGAFESRLKECGIKSQPVFVPSRLKTIRNISKALILEEPDIISVNREHNIYPTLLSYYLAAPSINKRPKLVAVFHTPTGRSYPLLSTLFDGVIATSEYTGASFWEKNPGLKQMTAIIHYGIEVPAVQVDKSNLNRERRVLKDRKFPVIGMVGELWKNQEELVDATVALKKVFPDITVAIVGGGGTEHLEKKIAEYGLESNVVLTGRIPRNQIPDLFYDFDLSVSTHRNEGFGIVHIESLAACTPVIAYNSGGLVEIIREGGGVLVDGSTDDFCREIIALLQNHERRESMGMEGREVVNKQFIIDLMVRKHADYYLKLSTGKGCK